MKEKKRPIYIERASEIYFHPGHDKTEPTLVFDFPGQDNWANYKGAGNFLENLGNAKRKQRTLDGKQETYLDMDKIHFYSYQNQQRITVTGEANINVLVNWAAKREDKNFINRLRRRKVLGAEQAYIAHLTPEEREKLYPTVHQDISTSQLLLSDAPATTPAEAAVKPDAPAPSPIGPAGEHPADTRSDPAPAVAEPNAGQAQTHGGAVQLTFADDPAFSMPAESPKESPVTPPAPAVLSPGKIEEGRWAEQILLGFADTPASEPPNKYTEKLGDKPRHRKRG